MHVLKRTHVLQQIAAAYFARRPQNTFLQALSAFDRANPSSDNSSEDSTAAHALKRRAITQTVGA